MIPRARAVLLAASLLALGSASAADQPPTERPLVHWRMVGGLAAWGPEALNPNDRQVIRDRTTFRKMWKRLHAAAAVVPALPSIDFARESVVVVPLGMLAGSGQAVHEQFVDTGASIRLTYVIELAGQDCEAAPGVTAPVLVLRTPRIDKPLTFVEDRLVRDCQ